MNISTASLGSIAKLRPPFARSALLLFPYTSEGRVNAGITVEMEDGEVAVAPGTGTVEKIYTELPRWQTSDESLRRSTVKHIVINHGNEVFTTVGGLSTVNVVTGATVTRGEQLGTLFTNQLFFSMLLGKKTVNPSTVNYHFGIQNSSVVIGQGGKIRFAPDRILRDLSRGITALYNAGLNYFSPPAPFLINIAFNGDGGKTGLAATGIADTDYWNVYVPTDFVATASYACYYGGFYDFSEDVVLPLQDYANELSPAIFERIAPLFSAAATGGSWDDMLEFWIGGYVGPVPYENNFRIRNIPAGVYNLYLYANEGTFPAASTFYASVNVDAPTSETNNPSIASGFEEGVNYVLFQLTVPANSYITFKVVGYLSGLQLERT